MQRQQDEVIVTSAVATTEPRSVAKPRQDLSPEMRGLLAALRARPEGALPGVTVPVVVRFLGGRYWQVDGAPRCWQTETVQALYRRRLIERATHRTYRASGPSSEAG